MKKQRRLIILEMIFIMLPVSLLAIPASIWILISSFGKYKHFYHLRPNLIAEDIIMQFAAMVSLLAIFSLWSEISQYTDSKPYIRSKNDKFHMVSIVCGCVVCILGWLDFLFPHYSLKALVQIHAAVGFLEIFTIGTPLMLPAFHVFYLRNKQVET